MCVHLIYIFPHIHIIILGFKILPQNLVVVFNNPQLISMVVIKSLEQ
jgi:hypothetical protein